jgi:hypothetical protein
MPAVTWSCPNCGRRVPLRVSQCHCGTTREDADRLAAAGGPAPTARGGGVPRPRPRRPGRAFRIGPLSWDLKALLVGIVVVILLGIASLFWPREPERIVPVLGYVNPRPPSPSPSAKPTPSPKGWKLPWK